MSGKRPLLRSPKLADGMTSEAIEESWVNVFMSELPRGIGRARWRFESNPAGANEPSDIGVLKPGRRTAKSRLQREPRLLFLYDVRRAMREPAVESHFGRVCAGSITAPQFAVDSPAWAIVTIPSTLS